MINKLLDEYYWSDLEGVVKTLFKNKETMTFDSNASGHPYLGQFFIVRSDRTGRNGSVTLTQSEVIREIQSRENEVASYFIKTFNSYLNDLKSFSVPARGLEFDKLREDVISRVKNCRDLNKYFEVMKLLENTPLHTSEQMVSFKNDVHNVLN